MGTKDFFDLFKINILKNSWSYFFLIVWLVVFSYIVSFLPKVLSMSTLEFLARIQKVIPDKDSWPIPFAILVFLVWVFTFILLKEIFDIIKDRIRRGESYIFTTNSWYKDWIYNGKTKLLDESTPILQVTSSRAGCLLEKYLWKNFEMKFQIRFMVSKDPNIGIIFRAKDLENYFMLELINKTNLVVKPHVRDSGMWEVMSQDALGSSSNTSVWLNVSLEVIDNKAKLEIENVGNYLWNLPTHIDINHIEDGLRKNENVNSGSQEDFSAKVTYLPKVEFRNNFGMIGFRAYLTQGADVKNLKIKRI